MIASPVDRLFLSMPPESRNRFRDNDMRKNKNLQRKQRIRKIATRFRCVDQRSVAWHKQLSQSIFLIL